MPSRLVPIAVAACGLAAACGAGSTEPEGAAVTAAEPGTTASSSPAAPGSVPTGEGSGQEAAGTLLPVVPGRAVVVAGDLRRELVVFECRVGAETSAPNRRLALSASETVPYDAAELFLSVDILVPRSIPDEEHRVSLFRMDGTSTLGASDIGVPSLGGRAPDDFVEVRDEDGRRVVRATGFELWDTSNPAVAPLPPGELVADCPPP